eukprot:jgi/Mesvir1/2557/Mv09614-RA.1
MSMAALSRPPYTATLLLLLCLAFPGVEPARKIFFIGFNKTGTHTLCVWLMTSLGFRCCHDYHWTEAASTYQVSYFQRRPGCQGYADGNRAAFVWLDAHFPGSLFVLNTRPLESWLVSRQAYYRDALPKWGSSLSRQKASYLASTPGDVYKWILVREQYHSLVLRYFLGAGAFDQAARQGPWNSTTGVIYRRVNPRTRGQALPAFFMVVDIVRDGEPTVRAQLEKLLNESHMEALAQERGVEALAQDGYPSDKTNLDTDGARGGPVRFASNPAMVQKSQPCVAAILGSLSLTAEERATDLLIGRPVPPFSMGGFDARRCTFQTA